MSTADRVLIPGPQAPGEEGAWSPVRVLAKAKPEAPHWNPVLRRGEDGRIVLYYKVGRNCSDWRTYFRESRDEGESWTPACEGLQSPHDLVEIVRRVEAGVEDLVSPVAGEESTGASYFLKD